MLAAGRISARWTGATVGVKAGAAAAAGAAGAEARPMAASKNAFCAAVRAASAPWLAAVGGAGKALGRIGVTGSRARLCYG